MPCAASVAENCESALRETDIVGRYGGEEFAVILPQTPREEAVETVAERLRRTVAETEVEWSGRKLAVTVSVGVACVRQACSMRRFAA